MTTTKKATVETTRFVVRYSGVLFGSKTYEIFDRQTYQAETGYLKNDAKRIAKMYEARPELFGK